MDIFYAIVLAAVQGITEFFPVSSSGHLVILHSLLQFNLDSNLSFDVALHSGTLFALLVYFYRDIINYFRRKDKILGQILVAIIPAGAVGFFLEEQIDYYLRSVWVVAIMLAAVGLLFLVVEKFFQPKFNLTHLTWKQALLIGLLQVLSLIPGTSRSGVTIMAGMAQGLRREQAARFSFLIGLPIFLAASLKKVYDLSKIGMSSEEGYLFVIGFLVAAVVGYFGIKYLLKLLTKYSLRGFAYYRLIIAGGLIIYLLIK